MTLSTTLTLVMLNCLLLGTPGPATLSLALSGSRFGFRRSVPYLTGILIGLAGNMILAGLGLAAVFSRFPGLELIFRYLSLCYIVYLAFKLFGPSGPGSDQTSPLRFLDGLVLNLINPKAYASSLALLAAFVEPGPHYGPHFIWFLTVSMIVGTVVDVGWVGSGALISRARNWSGHSPKQLTPAWNMLLAAALVLSALYATFRV